MNFSLLDELNTQPEVFFSEGRTYDLLQEYFKGEDISSLISLLGHKNLSTRKSAIWIVSELGKTALPLAEYVVPLLNDDERYIKYYALEFIMICSSEGSRGYFRYVVFALEDEDYIIRKLAMFLISNASRYQLEEAFHYFSNANNENHIKGLTWLLDDLSDIKFDNYEFVELYGKNHTLAMYRAISLKRYIQVSAKNVNVNLDQVQDEATKVFLHELES